VKRLQRGFSPEVLAAIGLGLIPALWLGYGVFTDNLGINPVETLIRQLGEWGLKFILLGLLLSPLALIIKKPWLVRLRRPIGLLSLAYISVHLTIYVWLENDWKLDAIIKDVLKRPFITLGMLGFILLLTLGLTSFNAAIKALGGRLWRNLHKLVYLIAILGVAHFYLLAKADKREPLVYAAILALLLGYRGFEAYNKHMKLNRA
jgi:methionine sulfoxide reductase heme-binding subunit